MCKKIFIIGILFLVFFQIKAQNSELNYQGVVFAERNIVDDKVEIELSFVKVFENDIENLSSKIMIHLSNKEGIEISENETSVLKETIVLIKCTYKTEEDVRKELLDLFKIIY